MIVNMYLTKSLSVRSFTLEAESVEKSLVIMSEITESRSKEMSEMEPTVLRPVNENGAGIEFRVTPLIVNERYLLN